MFFESFDFLWISLFPLKLKGGRPEASPRPAWGRPFKNLKFEIRSEFALKSPFSLWFYTLETLSRTWSSQICKKRFQNFGKLTFFISPTSDFWTSQNSRPAWNKLKAGLEAGLGRDGKNWNFFIFDKNIFFQVSECETNFSNSFLIYFYTHTLFKVHHLKSFSLCFSAWNMWETQIKKRL